jgi:hypothetical protein
VNAPHGSGVVNPPSPRRIRRTLMLLGLLGLLVVTAPVWGHVALLFTIAGLDELGQRTRISQAPPGTMPLVAPGREASEIFRGGPCYMCASGRRGSIAWGSSPGTATQLYMIDREAFALVPRGETPLRVQLVALEPMVILLRDDPDEVAPEEGFPPSAAYLLVHGGRKRLWHGTHGPGPLEGVAWASPGKAPQPVSVIDGRGIIPLPKGRLVLTEAAGAITVTRE